MLFKKLAKTQVELWPGKENTCPWFIQNHRMLFGVAKLLELLIIETEKEGASTPLGLSAFLATFLAI